MMNGKPLIDVEEIRAYTIFQVKMSHKFPLNYFRVMMITMKIILKLLCYGKSFVSLMPPLNENFYSL